MGCGEGGMLLDEGEPLSQSGESVNPHMGGTCVTLGMRLGLGHIRGDPASAALSGLFSTQSRVGFMARVVFHPHPGTASGSSLP